MFSLVALLCFYIGGNNIRKAFLRAPFGQWEFISWALFATGILLIPAGFFCVTQAVKDYKEAQKTKEEKAKAEKAKRQRQFFFDDEEACSTPEENTDE